MVRALFASLATVALAAEPSKNIVELAESVPALSTLVAAVVAGDLADTLSSKGPFTVFAPTNDAFGALPAGTLDSLMKPENKEQLVDILTFHVLGEQVLSTDLDTFQRVSTVEGKEVLVFSDAKNGVRVSPDGVNFNTVSGADNLASNGVAHIIDGVLLPPAKALPNIVELAQSVDDLSTLVTAVVAGDLADTLSGKGTFTVFAPTNDAFAALPAGTVESLLKPENKDELVDILTYHVLSEEVLSTSILDKTYSKKTVEGKSVQIKSSRHGFSVGPRDAAESDFFAVAKADNVASNGIVHVINGVLLPPLPNIVELAESVADLSTLVSAVVAGDLADTLSGNGPFTVFAPTNDAFGALPAGTLDTLMKPENKGQLVDILTFHVVPQKAFAKDLDLFQALTTVEGKPLHVQKWGGVVKVGASLSSADLKTVTGADNEASNGVVHVIDGVLLPPSEIVV
jgi:transforming growth factor-beta-induced protein